MTQTRIDAVPAAPVQSQDSLPAPPKLVPRMLHARVRDDRARPTRLLDHKRLSRTLEPVAAARIKWARAELREANFVFRMTLLAAAAYTSLVILDQSQAPIAVCALVALLELAAFLTVRARLNSMGTTRRLRRVAKRLTAHGICPTCAYRTGDLPSEHDGCVVCPECGGAWQPSLVAPERAHDTVQAEPCNVLLTTVKPRYSAWVKDARGWKLPAIRTSLEAILAAPWSANQRSRLAAAADGARLATRSGRAWLATFHFVMAIFFLGAIVWFVMLARRLIDGTSTLSQFELITGSLLILFGMFVVVTLTVHLRSALSALCSREWFASKTGAECLARWGFCAACIADLSALQPDPDGCTTCPECGAAWRIPHPQAELETPTAPYTDHNRVAR